MRQQARYDLEGRRVWVAGHTGMVDSAVVRRLGTEAVGKMVTATSSEVDLRDQAKTLAFVKFTRPDVIVLAAAKLGGIQANATDKGNFSTTIS